MDERSKDYREGFTEGLTRGITAFQEGGEGLKRLQALIDEPQQLIEIDWDKPIRFIPWIPAWSDYKVIRVIGTDYEGSYPIALEIKVPNQEKHSIFLFDRYGMKAGWFCDVLLENIPEE